MKKQRKLSSISSSRPTPSSQQPPALLFAFAFQPALVQSSAQCHKCPLGPGPSHSAGRALLCVLCVWVCWYLPTCFELAATATHHPQAGTLAVTRGNRNCAAGSRKGNGGSSRRAHTCGWEIGNWLGLHVSPAHAPAEPSCRVARKHARKAQAATTQQQTKTRPP